MKTSILNLRLDTRIKVALDEIGIAQDKSASAITRDAIDLYLKENNPDLPDISILQTFGFAELIFWIMNKKDDPFIGETDSLYEQHYNLLVELNNYSIFSKEILVELNKVRDELADLLNNVHDHYEFKFSTLHGGFNYDELHGFMHTVRFDSDDNRVINIK